MKKTKKVTKTLIVVLAVMFIANIAVGVTSAVSGSKLEALDSQATKLESQNKELKEKLVSQSSLIEVGEYAKSVGMNEAKSIVYLNTGPAVAQLPR